jgi:hypothetical protein
MTLWIRMKTPTGADEPRWQYLLYKIIATLAGGAALAQVTTLPALWTTSAVATVYVAIGLWRWYRRRRIVITTGPGQIIGDAWYHGILSAAAVMFYLPILPPLRLAAFLGCLLVWWALENAGYGVVRNPSEGLQP